MAVESSANLFFDLVAHSFVVAVGIATVFALGFASTRVSEGVFAKIVKNNFAGVLLLTISHLVQDLSLAIPGLKDNELLLTHGLEAGGFLFLGIGAWALLESFLKPGSKARAPQKGRAGKKRRV